MLGFGASASTQPTDLEKAGTVLKAPAYRDNRIGALPRRPWRGRERYRDVLERPRYGCPGAEAHGTNMIW